LIRLSHVVFLMHLMQTWFGVKLASQIWVLRVSLQRSSMDRWRCDASVAMRVVYA